MKERPILFSGPMVKAILEDRKSTTRRSVKRSVTDCVCEDLDFIQFEHVNEPIIRKDGDGNNPYEYKGWLAHHIEYPEEGSIEVRSPYGQPGDRLWVREICYIWGQWVENGITKTGRKKYRFKAEGPNTVVFNPNHPQVAKHRSTRPLNTKCYWFRPSIHMPRWASRILLEITDIRVERLQDITEEDACDEGIKQYENHDFGLDEPKECMGTSAKLAFMRLWNHINGPASWDANPWVWVVKFKRAVTKP